MKTTFVTRLLKRQIHRLLNRAGLQLVPLEHWRQARQFEAEAGELLKLPPDDLRRAATVAGLSKSQIGQDLFALAQTDFKQAGYFVEFGATNGLDLSNTHLLETQFGWTGILAEPARCWHQDLVRNRKCRIDTRCVWKASGSKLSFHETDSAELSTVEGFLEHDAHSADRRDRNTYLVDTVSLTDLLDNYQAPNEIDYLSIDTEGSEYEILRHFDFSRYRFSVITCEHNYQPNRELIHRLLTSQGYVRLYTGLSRWDDWYVHSDLRRPRA